MADHAAAHAIHDPNIGNTGLDHRKMGMWIFLGSDCMFFGSLIGTYLSYKGKSLSGPVPREVFDIPLTSYSAALLLASSLFMVLALAALQQNRIRVSAWWLLATAALGLHFVLNQVYEFTTFVLHYNLTLSTNLFGSSFFVLTGFHGAHVSGGVIWLTILAVLALRGKLDSRDYTKVEIAGLYWHFVDIVWIAIFTIVYLIP
ncbi:MAG TPA: heme-copper oxidase subunit III [Methylomirabilota bacterium]|nr:heme-copper oxidase subunit III [Methylomirabilota bacterium]